MQLARLMQKFTNEGTPLMWKGGDMAPVPRKLGPFATANIRELLCSSALARWLQVR